MGDDYPLFDRTSFTIFSVSTVTLERLPTYKLGEKCCEIDLSELNLINLTRTFDSFQKLFEIPWIVNILSFLFSILRVIKFLTGPFVLSLIPFSANDAMITSGVCNRLVDCGCDSLSGNERAKVEDNLELLASPSLARWLSKHAFSLLGKKCMIYRGQRLYFAGEWKTFIHHPKMTRHFPYSTKTAIIRYVYRCSLVQFAAINNCSLV